MKWKRYPLPEMNKYLKTIGMEMNKVNNQYRVIASDETHMRQLFAGFLLELYGLNLKKWELDVDLSLFGKIIHQTLIENLETEITRFVFKDDLAEVYYIMYYLVSLVRENQGIHDTRYDRISYADASIEDEELKRLMVFFPNITFDSIRSIHGFILSQYIGWDNEEEKRLVESETRLFYQRFFDDVQLSPAEETRKNLEFMLRSLYLSQKLRPFENSALFDRIRYFSMTIKQYNYPLYQSYH